MALLIPLAILFAFCSATWLLRRAGYIPIHPAQAREEVRSGATSSTGRQDGLTWTALDDLQLTRFLIESARRTDSE